MCMCEGVEASGFERSMNESCHTSMSHVKYMKVSCYTCTWMCLWRGEGDWVWALDEWIMSCRSMSHVTYMNVSCYRCTWACMRERARWLGLSARWMSHVTHQRVMSHTWMCHIIGVHECVWERGGGRVGVSARWMSHVSHHTYECVILKVYMSVYVWEGRTSGFERSMNESCHADQWVLSHIWMCHITAVHECVYVRGGDECVWALDEWVMSRRSMSHVTYMNVSYYSCTWMCICERGGWVCLSTRWMSHVTQINESCHIYECVILQLYMSVYAWEGGGECVCTFVILQVYMSVYMWEGRASLFERSMKESWRADQWVVSHTWMCHITGVHECVCVRGGGRVGLSARWMSLVTHQWVMSHIWKSHITGVHECVCVIGGRAIGFERSMNESRHVDQWVMSHIWMCHVTRAHECVCVRGGGRVCLSARWMSHGAQINESFHIYKFVILQYMNVYAWEGGMSGFERSMNESCHRSMSHVTHMNVSYYTCTWGCMRARGGRVGLSARWMSHVT